MTRRDFIWLLGLIGCGTKENITPAENMDVKRFYSIISGGGFNLDSYMDVLNLQSATSNDMTIGAGNRISSWRDTPGNDFLQGTDSSRPTLTSGVPLFDGGDTMAMASDLNIGSVYSLYFVFRNTAGALSKIPFASKDVNDYAMHSSGFEFAFVGSASGAGGFGAKAGIGYARYSVLSVRRNGSATAKVKVNDRTCIITGSTFHASNGTLIGKLGDRYIAGFQFTGGIMALCASSQYVSDSVNEQIVNALYTRYNLSTYTNPEIVIGIGDSNTAGQGATSYVVGLASLMSLGYLNLGISGTLFTNVGATANNGYDRWTSQIISKPYKDYLVVQYGTNESSMERLPTYSTQMREKIAETIAAGWLPSRICMCSLPYIFDGASASILDAYRDEIQDIASDYGTKFFDLLQWMRDNGGNALLSDAVHLNQTGQDGWRDGVYAAFTS